MKIKRVRKIYKTREKEHVAGKYLQKAGEREGCGMWEAAVASATLTIS